ncbi:MAG TPA: DAK2 domain-containing protein [Clostridia bacterium]|nr:DAK2 domain-containing protein [Clostridia bacterium]
MNSAKIDGLLWAKLIIASSVYLSERKQGVDALNVFPVPDGDTGTNMSLTLASAAKAVAERKTDKLGELTKAMAYGALMGARGNSGVILSQLLSGFAKSTENEEEVDAQGFCDAWQMAVETAYQAVSNPVEGTILTVARESAQAAVNALQKSDRTINSVLQATYEGAYQALQQTPAMLPVLQQAGVVDAGGQGLVYILEGMLAALEGKMPQVQKEAFTPATAAPTRKLDYTGEQAITFQYCTEFILKKKDKPLALESVKSFLSDKGDCVLVVGNTDAGKIHIHTNRPGKVLDYCTDLGTLHEVQIHNMLEQSEEMRLKARAKKHLGIITVSLGSGLNEVFKSLGVDVVLTGGQTMNPSIQDLVEAIDQVLAEEVLILPNNSNVILAAEQAAGVASKPVRVVGTKTIPQGIAALMAFNAENDLETNKAKMEEASKQIVSLEVTYAVRDAEYDGQKIAKGQIIGIGEGRIATSGTQKDEVVQKLIAEFWQPQYELITIYYGEDVQEDEAEKLVEALSRQYPQADFELHYGGQPLYYYLLSIE